MMDSKPDSRTLAYINMYAVFGTLENLCEIDEAARALLKNKKPLAICFNVKNGPAATITFFPGGRCRMEDGVKPCDIMIPFSSCEKFNGMINGEVTPIPSKGFIHLGFLLKSFVPLTDLLTKYLRAMPEDLADPVFYERSTTLMLYTIGVAIAQIANNDEIGKFSAHLIVDGDVKLGVKDGPAVTIRAEDHHLITVKKAPEIYRAVMEFENIKLARQLFDGEINAVACIGSGAIKMGGMISMVDNINRILDRVALYLA